MTDTAFPFLLFLSQTETEAVLGEHLVGCGVQIERGVQFEGYADDGEEWRCVLRHGDGRQEELRARYLIGCDGAHSTVRQQAGIEFGGSRYPQTFVLADLDVDGLQPDAVNVFVTERAWLPPGRRGQRAQGFYGKLPTIPTGRTHGFRRGGVGGHLPISRVCGCRTPGLPRSGRERCHQCGVGSSGLVRFGR